MFSWVDMLSDSQSRTDKAWRFMRGLAPLLYAPKLVGEIEMGFGKGNHIRLPLDRQGWRSLSPLNQQRLWRQVQRLNGKHQGERLLGDRRFRLELGGKTDILFGDVFRMVLLAVLVEARIQSYAVRRLIFITENPPALESALEYFSHLQIPVMIQNFHPARMEIFCWQMLHQRGIAISCGNIRPQEWRTGDLIVSFWSGVRAYLPSASGISALILDDASVGWARELEAAATASGLDGSLAVLAPLLEYVLLCPQEQPQGLLQTGKDMEKMIQRGKGCALWSAFLAHQEDGWI